MLFLGILELKFILGFRYNFAWRRVSKEKACREWNGSQPQTHRLRDVHVGKGKRDVDNAGQLFLSECQPMQWLHIMHSGCTSWVGIVEWEHWMHSECGQSIAAHCRSEAVWKAHIQQIALIQCEERRVAHNGDVTNTVAPQRHHRPLHPLHLRHLCWHCCITRIIGVWYLCWITDGLCWITGALCVHHLFKTKLHARLFYVQFLIIHLYFSKFSFWVMYSEENNPYSEIWSGEMSEIYILCTKKIDIN